MKKIFNILMCGLLAVSGTLTSCNDYDELNRNPDKTTKVPASMLATGLILTTVTPTRSSAFFHSDMLMKSIAWTEQAQNIQYNKIDRSNFSGYPALINGIKMIEAAEGQNIEAWTALNKFVKAYTIFNISMEMGDVPYSEALQGESGNITPKYDTQKDVMAQVLADLEEAYTLFGKAQNFNGDPIYGGDVDKWQRACASFELKVLMHCSKRADDTPDLRIKERFANIVTSCKIMESNADNYQLVFTTKQGERYPVYADDFKYNMYPRVGSMIVDNMRATKDVRLFYYAEPAAAKLAEGKTAADWDAYVGVDPSDAFSDILAADALGNCCDINERYKKHAQGEPYVKVGYADQCFILAEGAQRGWISGSADTYYKQGIEASMRFIGDCTPDTYAHGHVIDDAAIASFLAQPEIQLTASNALEMILTQRYLATFMQDPGTNYYNYRRTGFPKLNINPNTSLNDVKEQLPMRYRYPESEASYNNDNLKAALDRQFGGDDNNNALMWIIK